MIDLLTDCLHIKYFECFLPVSIFNIRGIIYYAVSRRVVFNVTRSYFVQEFF